MPSEDTSFRLSYPLGFLARTAVASGVACLGGLALLRWIFSRPLGAEFGPAFYTLKSVVAFLAPALAFSLLAVLLVASLAVFVVAVFASHKIAGPLFRLQRVAGYLRRRVLVGRIHLRAADQGKPVADEINAWIAQRKGQWAALRRQAVELEEVGGRWETARAQGAADAEQRALARVREVAAEIAGFGANEP